MGSAFLQSAKWGSQTPYSKQLFSAFPLPRRPAASMAIFSVLDLRMLRIPTACQLLLNQTLQKGPRLIKWSSLVYDFLLGRWSRFRISQSSITLFYHYSSLEYILYYYMIQAVCMWDYVSPPLFLQSILPYHRFASSAWVRTRAVFLNVNISGFPPSFSSRYQCSPQDKLRSTAGVKE
jgi:hypothetical protein